MRTVHRAVSGTVRSLIRLRERSGFVDHTWRAIQRYDRQDGSRLAAATAYYGFFATFALAVLLFAILGATLARVTPAQTTAEDYLRQNLPLRDVHALVDASRGVSVLAIGALVLAGIWWIESMRASQRAMWHLDQHPGNIVVRYLWTWPCWSGWACCWSSRWASPSACRTCCCGWPATTPGRWPGTRSTGPARCWPA